jgi:hypothetical protein
MGERLRTVVGGVLFIACSWWGVTYIPVVQDMVPNLTVAPDSTVKLTLTDADVASGKVPTDRLDGPCHDIPFLLRPIASPPDHVKVIFNYQGRDFGEGLYGCHDFHEISSKQY